MGFWGVVLVARTPATLSTLRSVQALGGDPEDGGARRTDAWALHRVHQPDRDDDAALQSIADEAGGPVLAAFVFDSDTAWVRLAAPRQGFLKRAPKIVTFYVDPESARGYDIDVDDRAEAAAPGAVVAWAGGGDVDAVRTVLEREHVFAEDGVLRLAAAFGAIPADETTEWTFGDDD